jgi:hypothetical protein
MALTRQQRDAGRRAAVAYGTALRMTPDEMRREAVWHRSRLNGGRSEARTAQMLDAMASRPTVAQRRRERPYVAPQRAARPRRGRSSR